MVQYYTKPQPVEVWQYNGNIVLTELPWWVVELILHCNLGYREVDTVYANDIVYGRVTAMQYFDGLNWVIVSDGDWLVRYDECTIGVVPDKKFKESFEEAESRSITTTIVK